MTAEAFLSLVEARLLDLAGPLAGALGRPAAEIGLHAGKRARPRLVHACAEAVQLAPKTAAQWAAFVEIIHLASLVHDDVIDGASLRRGQPALCARDGNRRAVLAGDLLVSAAWLRAAEELPPQVTGILARAMMEMTRAELRETELLWNPNATLSLYLNVIDGKTAALFSAAAEGTAVLADAPGAVRQAFARSGRALGRAFQIEDDVRDYALGSQDSGKDARRDLAQGLVTLPLIVALKRDDARAALTRHYLRSRGTTGFEVEALDGLLRDSGALDRSLRLARRFLAQGLAGLAPLPRTLTIRQVAFELARACPSGRQPLALSA
jgi:geranylgeranyl pyrophosphate synthase